LIHPIYPYNCIQHNGNGSLKEWFSHLQNGNKFSEQHRMLK